PVLAEWGAPLLATVDRGAAVALGIKSFGIHLNGVVEAADGPLLWVAKRAADRALAPGKLDNLVAGGQPAGLSLVENLVKECAEEAAIPAGLARQAVPAGAITYMMDTAEGLRRDTLFVYDLALTPDFTPRNTDGEVESFARRPLAAVLDQLRDTEDFKFNVALVIIDLAIRRGVVGPEEPDYLALCRGLREPTDPPSHHRAG
ncbi:NUDIX hydrolase, partial [Inquilinus limosus]|uniref:NUDIX hydrolase n=1 Tax=Inquilinus limosus TaxID=171674 RepID=UPI0013766A08